MIQHDEAESPRRAAWPATYGALVFAVAVVLGWSMRSVLWPTLLFPLFLLLLLPFAGDRRHRVAVIGFTVLFGAWMLDTLGGLLVPFLLAAALAYILDPLADLLQRRGVPRSIAILLIALPALGIVALLLIFGVPALIGEVEDLLSRLPAALERIEQWVATLDTRLATIDLPIIDERQLIARIQASLDSQRIMAFIQERQGEILRSAWSTALGVGRGVGAIVGILGYVVLTPVLLFYLLRDWDSIMQSVASLFPEPSRDRWIAFAKEYNQLLSRFLRGQLLAAAIVGVLTWLGLLIVGFPNSGLVGAIAGIFNIVPYLGLIVSILPVVLIAIISGNVLGLLLRAGIVFAIIQFIDGSVTGPRITGESTGLHPVWVILALAIAGFAFGFAGLLLAMPLAVLIKLLLREAMNRYRASSVFRGNPTPEP